MADNASAPNASNTPAASRAAAPLIPREVLFGNPKRASPQISPDGKHLAYLAPDDRNVLQVWLRGFVGRSGGAVPGGSAGPRPRARDNLRAGRRG